MKTLSLEFVSLKILSFFIIALMLAGCSSNQKVIVTKEQDKVPVVQRTPFTDYESALINADFRQAERLAASGDQKKCVKAYESFAAGDEKLSEQTALPLLASEDSLVKKYSKQLVSNIYFAQSRWAELNKFAEGQPELMAEKILSAAYSTQPKEEVIFNGSSVKQPITFSSSGTPVLEVEVNGVKKHFWFDTGAGLTVIASDAAEECDVHQIGKDTAQGETSTSINVGILPVVISDLKIAGVRVKNHPAMIINKKDLEFKFLGIITLLKVDGIIGWNLISQLGWDIDYKNKTILPFSGENVTNSFRPNFMWFGYPAAALKDTSGRQMLFGMDTGAQNTSLSQYFIVPAEVKAGQTETKTYGGAGGYETVEVQKLENVSLNFTGSRLFFPSIYKKEHDFSSAVQLHGVLGSDFLKESRLIIDYPHRRIILE